VSESGDVLAEAKYTPWGKQRNLAGDLPTDYGFTGQREESRSVEPVCVIFRMQVDDQCM
jgi:hypothetical protein